MIRKPVINYNKKSLVPIISGIVGLLTSENPTATYIEKLMSLINPLNFYETIFVDISIGIGTTDSTKNTQENLFTLLHKFKSQSPEYLTILSTFLNYVPVNRLIPSLAYINVRNSTDHSPVICKIGNQLLKKIPSEFLNLIQKNPSELQSYLASGIHESDTEFLNTLFKHWKRSDSTRILTDSILNLKPKILNKLTKDMVSVILENIPPEDHAYFISNLLAKNLDTSVGNVIRIAYSNSRNSSSSDSYLYSFFLPITAGLSASVVGLGYFLSTQSSPSDKIAQSMTVIRDKTDQLNRCFENCPGINSDTNVVNCTFIKGPNDTDFEVKYTIRLPKGDSTDETAILDRIKNELKNQVGESLTWRNYRGAMEVECNISGHPLVSPADVTNLKILIRDYTDLVTTNKKKRSDEEADKSSKTKKIFDLKFQFNTIAQSVNQKTGAVENSSVNTQKMEKTLAEIRRVIDQIKKFRTELCENKNLGADIQKMIENLDQYENNLNQMVTAYRTTISIPTLPISPALTQAAGDPPVVRGNLEDDPPMDDPFPLVTLPESSPDLAPSITFPNADKNVVKLWLKGSKQVIPEQKKNEPPYSNLTDYPIGALINSPPHSDFDVKSLQYLKNIFHDKFDRVLNSIINTTDKDYDKIKSGLYDVLNHAMGDIGALDRSRIAYCQLGDRGTTTGLGHASQNSAENLKKLIVYLDKIERGEIFELFNRSMISNFQDYIKGGTYNSSIREMITEVEMTNQEWIGNLVDNLTIECDPNTRNEDRAISELTAGKVIYCLMDAYRSKKFTEAADEMEYSMQRMCNSTGVRLDDHTRDEVGTSTQLGLYLDQLRWLHELKTIPDGELAALRDTITRLG